MNQQPLGLPSRTLDANGEPIASRYVRALLSRHAVPASQHATKIADILSVGYTLAYRRLRGTVAWAVEEIDGIAKHFGESLASVFAEDRLTEEVSAVLLVGASRRPCQLVPGAALNDPSRKPLVAVKYGEQWMVLLATQAGTGPWFDVTSLRFAEAGDRRWRIAVLDDNLEEASHLAQHFEMRGCDVAAYTSVGALVQALEQRSFDAYVLDWVLKEGPALELVGMIRADDRDCPIAVLTGQIPFDAMVEPAVAEAVSTYKLLFFEKPTRLPIISAQVLQLLMEP